VVLGTYSNEFLFDSTHVERPLTIDSEFEFWNFTYTMPKESNDMRLRPGEVCGMLEEVMLAAPKPQNMLYARHKA
jgi:hypothetical protein